MNSIDEKETACKIAIGDVFMHIRLLKVKPEQARTLYGIPHLDEAATRIRIKNCVSKASDIIAELLFDAGVEL